MKRIVLAVLTLGTLTVEAQYDGRRGVRYINQGTVFTPRRTNDWSQDRRDGKCTIRVRIDDDSDVELRGNQIRIHVIRGGAGRDEGSECNAPLPVTGNITNFRFRGIDGRGNPRLVQVPSNRNYNVAVVNVQDPKGGDEGYTFDLTWQWDGATGGGGGGGFFPGQPVTRPMPVPGNGGGGFFPDQPTTRPTPLPGGGGNYLQDMNVGIAGSGILNDGSQQYSLTDLNVQIRNNQCTIKLTTNQNQTLELSGRLNRNEAKCQLTSSNRGRVNGNALIFANGNNLTGVNVGGTFNGKNFYGNFRSR